MVTSDARELPTNHIIILSFSYNFQAKLQQIDRQQKDMLRQVKIDVEDETCASTKIVWPQKGEKFSSLLNNLLAITNDLQSFKSVYWILPVIA